MTEIQQVKVIETTPIGGRIKLLMQHYGLNMNKLSIRLKIPSNSVITRLVNDPRRGISLDYLQKILNEFPDINCRWLVLGEGEMLRSQIKPEVEVVKECEKCPKLEEQIVALKQDKEDLRQSLQDLRITVNNLRDTFGLKKKQSV